MSEGCNRCGHIRDGHKEALGGICIGCPCPGFEPSPVVHHMTDEEYVDSYEVWREHQDMHR